MSVGIDATLSSLTRQAPRIVREHEILRVAGWVPGDDAPAIANVAIKEVLKWAKKRCGGNLPLKAWRHESFNYLSGGRNSNCVRLQSGSSDLWAIRTDDPDKTVPGRNWTTEVVVGLLPDQPVKFSTRLLVSTSEPDLQIEPHTPGFIQQIVERCELVSGQRQFSVEPTIFETGEDVEELAEHLVNPSRRLPVIVITLPENSETSYPLLDMSELSRAVLGIGYVALLHPSATWRLTERFGKLKSVFGGAARIYLPGFSDDADPYIHHLILAEQLKTTQGIARATRWMRQIVAQESVRRVKLGRDVVSFASIRNASLELRQQVLKHENATESVQLIAANERVIALERQVASLEAEQDYYVAEYEKERERAEVAEIQAQNAVWRIQHLNNRIQTHGDDPDSDTILPSVWVEFAEWCDQRLAGRVALTSTARRGVRKPVYENIEMAAHSVLWLATKGRDRFMSGGGTLSNIPIFDGIQNAPCGADAYDFGWNGRWLSADWHVVDGGRTRDPTRCLRIYYCFDPQTQQIVISDMPAHRRTGAT